MKVFMLSSKKARNGRKMATYKLQNIFKIYSYKNCLTPLIGDRRDTV